MLKFKTLAFLFLLLIPCAAFSQQSVGTYQVRVAPDRDDWTYELNQPAKFEVAVTLNNRQAAGFQSNTPAGWKRCRRLSKKP
jgi:hypothetical protein